MIVAYLVNQYPHVSHTFIRREIAALERHGLTVKRFSIRPAPKDLVDPADISECQKTHVILDDGFLVLFWSTCYLLMTRPLRWMRTIIMTRRLRRRSDRGIIRHLAYFAEACRLQRLTRDIDHLHAHFGTNSATVALLCRMLGGPPFSFTVHGPEEFDKPESLSLGIKIHYASFVVAISHYGRSQLCRWSQSDDWPKLQVVRCGLDAEFVKAEPTPVPSNHQLVCVGRLSEQKGQLLLLDALAELRNQNVRFQMVLAGDGPMRRDIETKIEQLQLQAHVEITGWISGARVRQLICESRALVLPSFAEGLPVVLMEALALGRPVVTTSIAGIPELVQPGINGWLVPAGSTHDLVIALRELLATDPARLTEMGRRGCTAVRQLHNVDLEARKLAELFGTSR